MWSSIDAADSSSAVRVGESIGEVFALSGWPRDGARVDVMSDLMDAVVLGEGKVSAGGIEAVIDG